MSNFTERLRGLHSTKDDQVSTARSHSNGEGIADLATVGIAKVQIEPESRVTLLTDPSGPGADRFRLLRMRLEEARSGGQLRSLAITSPLPQDGKSTIASNLATALADGGRRRVLVIEADLHRPSLARSLGIQPQPGLAECLELGWDPISTIRRLEPLSWCLLEAGNARSNATELLQKDSMSVLMGMLSAHFDWILVDTPPATPLTDAVSVSQRVDATLLVVRAGHTSRKAVDEALVRLGTRNLVGIVLNGADSLNHAYTKHYRHYGMSYRGTCT
jgi:capsular exopolysaccharide synthesis family protein